MIKEEEIAWYRRNVINKYVDEVMKEINLLQAQNEGLKKQNAELQKENAKLKAENARLITCLQVIKAIAEELLEKGLEPQSVEHQLRLRGKRELASIIIDLITKTESEVE